MSFGALACPRRSPRRLLRFCVRVEKRLLSEVMGHGLKAANDDEVDARVETAQRDTIGGTRALM